MAHVRQQIIDAVATAVTGLTATGANVFKSRALPLSGAQLPALCVYARTDDPNYDDATLPDGANLCAVNRSLECHIQGFSVKEDDTLLNTIASEVEVAMYADQTFGGVALGMNLGIQELADSEVADQQYRSIDIIFNILYRVREGAPDTAL